MSHVLFCFLPPLGMKAELTILLVPQQLEREEVEAAALSGAFVSREIL